MERLYQILKSLIIIFITGIVFTNTAIPGQKGIEGFQYLSPVPWSKLNQPETNIIIRYSLPFNRTDIIGGNILEVTGSKSGRHSGRLILSEEDKTLLFYSDVPFSEGENVIVKLSGSVRTSNNERIPPLSFSFSITGNDINKQAIKNPEKFHLNFIRL